MKITLFEGDKFSSVEPSEAIEAASGGSESHSLWVDVLIDSAATLEASAFLREMGVNPDRVLAILTSNVELAFRLTTTDMHGVAWLDDNDGNPASLVLFHWEEKRLLTVRFSGERGMAFVRKRLLERLPAVRASSVRLLADTLRLMMVTVQRGLTDIAVRVGELNMEVLGKVRPDPEQNAELATYRAVFHALALRFPGYLVNARAALIDPPPIKGMNEEEITLFHSYVTIVDNTQVLIDSVENSFRNVSRDLQAQTAMWQGTQINALTAMAAVFIPITFITSYFGMNFGWMVGKVDTFGHFLFFGVGLLTLVVMIALLLLRRSGYSLRVDENAGRKRARSRLMKHKKALDDLYVSSSLSLESAENSDRAP